MYSCTGHDLLDICSTSKLLKFDIVEFKKTDRLGNLANLRFKENEKHFVHMVSSISYLVTRMLIFDGILTKKDQSLFLKKKKERYFKKASFLVNSIINVLESVAFYQEKLSHIESALRFFAEKNAYCTT